MLKQSSQERAAMRLGIPSKGRMAEDTLELLKNCQLKCEKPNPRQYFGQIGQFPDVEVWFQRASDVVRKLRTGDLDIGIVGLDMFSEFAEEDTDLVVIHDALDFGQCKLALGVPTGGPFADVSSLEDLKALGWSEANPLRVVTGYTNIARRCASRLLHALLAGSPVHACMLQHAIASQAQAGSTSLSIAATGTSGRWVCTMLCC